MTEFFQLDRPTSRGVQILENAAWHLQHELIKVQKNKYSLNSKVDKKPDAGDILTILIITSMLFEKELS